MREACSCSALLGQDDTQQFRVLNGGSGIATTVGHIARLVTEAWGSDIEVRFSGSACAGDPFSLVADAQQVSALPFSWRIRVEQGIGHYVSWFKGQSL